MGVNTTRSHGDASLLSRLRPTAWEPRTPFSLASRKTSSFSIDLDTARDADSAVSKALKVFHTQTLATSTSASPSLVPDQTNAE